MFSSNDPVSDPLMYRLYLHWHLLIMSLMAIWSLWGTNRSTILIRSGCGDKKARVLWAWVLFQTHITFTMRTSSLIHLQWEHHHVLIYNENLNTYSFTMSRWNNIICTVQKQVFPKYKIFHLFFAVFYWGKDKVSNNCDAEMISLSIAGDIFGIPQDWTVMVS